MTEKLSLKSETNIAKKLLEIKAVELSVDHPFTWASGIQSPIYCDNRQTLSYPSIRNLIADSFANMASEWLPFDTIAGVATGGIAHGVLVAERLDKPFIYVRSGKKEHGTKKQVEGRYDKGQSCVVIEDLISTGKSSLEAVRALRDEGLEVKVVISIFTYQFDEADRAFRDHNCEYQSLCNYTTLLQHAVNQKIISTSQLNHLAEWRKNPRVWNN